MSQESNILAKIGRQPTTDGAKPDEKRVKCRELKRGTKVIKTQPNSGINTTLGGVDAS